MQKSEDFIMIGGVGDSGTCTHVFAEILRNDGIRSLSDLNHSHPNDRLDFVDGFIEKIYRTNEPVKS